MLLFRMTLVTPSVEIWAWAALRMSGWGCCPLLSFWGSFQPSSVFRYVSLVNTSFHCCPVNDAFWQERQLDLAGAGLFHIHGYRLPRSLWSSKCVQGLCGCWEGQNLRDQWVDDIPTTSCTLHWVGSACYWKCTFDPCHHPQISLQSHPLLEGHWQSCVFCCNGPFSRGFNILSFLGSWKPSSISLFSCFILFGASAGSSNCTSFPASIWPFLFLHFRGHSGSMVSSCWSDSHVQGAFGLPLVKSRLSVLLQSSDFHVEMQFGLIVGGSFWVIVLCMSAISVSSIADVLWRLGILLKFRNHSVKISVVLFSSGGCLWWWGQEKIEAR